MNVCRVSRAFFPILDGGAQHVWGLSRAQVRGGHKVWLLEPYVDAWPDVPAGLTIHKVPGLFGLRTHSMKLAIAAFGVRASRRIRRIHESHPLDIIHIHGDSLDAASLALGLRNRRIPIVQTLHGSLSGRWLYRRTAVPMFKAVSRFIVVSSTIKQDLVRLGIPADRVDVITSGIDLHRFANPAPTTRVAAPFQIVSVGRLHPVKGYEYLIEAMRELQSRGVAATLTVIGGGPDRGRLTDVAKDLSCVKFLGEVQPAAVAGHLAGADAFALASVNIGIQAEGMPTAIMEAMAVGLPIICTDSGGIADAVRHGENGFVVPARNPQALADAIQNLAAHPALRAAIRNRNRVAAAAKDWSKIAARIDETYERARLSVRGR